MDRSTLVGTADGVVALTHRWWTGEGRPGRARRHAFSSRHAGVHLQVATADHAAGMTSSLLHLACADLHPDCPASLWGTSTEELVLAYALHDVDGHATGTASLDALLRSITREPRAALPLRPTAASSCA